MSMGMIVSCASFNSPYRGRVISSVADANFASEERDGHIFVKTTYQLSSPQHGIHELRIPIDIGFIHHSAQKLFAEIDFSYVLDGNDFKCYKGYDVSKTLIPGTEYKRESSRWDYSELKCINSSDVENAKVSVTYKFKKSENFKVEKLEQYSISNQFLNSGKIPAGVKEIYSYHLKYIQSPSLYSDHTEVHKRVGQKSVVNFDAKKYGFQFSKKLEEGMSIFINPPQGKAQIHKIGEISAKGSSKKKARKNFLEQDTQAYALICKVTKRDGSIWNYDFSKYSNSRLSFSERELIECGINQPNKKRRLSKNEGGFQFSTSTLSLKIALESLEKAKIAPQEFINELAEKANRLNIQNINDKFKNTVDTYSKVIQNEKDIRDIAPALTIVETEVSRSVITLTPVKEKIIHEGKGLYFIDYDFYVGNIHKVPYIFNSYTRKFFKDHPIEIKESIRLKIKTNIQFDEEKSDELMKNRYVFLSLKDKEIFIKKAQELSLKKYVTEEELDNFISSKKSSNLVNESTKQSITLSRSSLKVCAEASSYEQELPRGSISKTQYTFNKVLSFYNHQDQDYKYDQVIQAKEIEPIVFKTSRNFSELKEDFKCFSLSSKDLAERKFKQFLDKK